MAMMPPFIGRLYADSAVFLTIPLRVAISRKLVVVELADGDAVLDLLPFRQRQQVDQRPALGRAALQRQVVDLLPVDLAAVR